MAYELGELGIVVKIIEPGGVDTDFGGRSLVFTTQEGLTDYDVTAGKFLTNRERASLGSSSAEYLAEAIIYGAATDGKSQMRYLIGEDAVQTYGMKQQVGDDSFIDLFAKEGFWNTPTSRIAKHAGVGTGTLVNYYESKDVLINAVYAHLKQEVMGEVIDDYPEAGSVKD